jgi:DNA helicase HerA-like ATPase
MGVELPTPVFELPRPDQRVAVIGRTGSGKTQMGTWLLSEAPFTQMPWVIIDFKYDALLNATGRIKEIGLTEKVPSDPGLYIVHPHPDDIGDLEKFLKRIWEQENTGVYIDEGYMIPDSAPFRALLTQGRSKRIPVITLSQRPAWISRFVFTESEHLCIFHLQHRRDQKVVEEFIPDDRGVSLRNRLPQYCSYWYSVSADHVFKLSPVPKAEELIEKINARLKSLQPNRSWF